MKKLQYIHEQLLIFWLSAELGGTETAYTESTDYLRYGQKQTQPNTEISSNNLYKVKLYILLVCTDQLRIEAG